jgi:hypothetical protein
MKCKGWLYTGKYDQQPPSNYNTDNVQTIVDNHSATSMISAKNDAQRERNWETRPCCSCATTNEHHPKHREPEKHDCVSGSLSRCASLDFRAGPCLSRRRGDDRAWD